MLILDLLVVCALVCVEERHLPFGIEIPQDFVVGFVLRYDRALVDLVAYSEQ